MGWFIAGVLVLLLIGGLIGFGRARERDRQPADDTLLAELLGEDVTPPPPPPPLAAVRLDDPGVPLDDPGVPPDDPGVPLDDTAVLPPAHTPDGTEIMPVLPPPQAAAVPSAPPAPRPAQARATPEPPESRETPDQPAPDTPAGDGDWLESQLAWIRNWSERMQDQIGPGSAQEANRQTET